MRSAYLLFLAPALMIAAQEPGATQAGPADERMRHAAAAAQKGDLQTAIADYQQIIAAHPDSLGAHVGLGAAFAAAGRLDEAIEEDSRALAIAPGDVEAQMNLAMAYFRKGDLSRARAQYEAALRAHPLELRAAMGLAYTYVKLGRNADAASLLMPFEAGHESDLDLEYVLGYALILSGKPDEGVSRMEKVAQARHSPDSWTIAASTRFQRGDFKKALEDAEQGIAANPEFPGVHRIAGQAEYALGDREKAAKHFQQALQQNPRDFAANLYLGIIRENQRDFATARPLLELAVELIPNHPLARLELAKLDGMTGRLAEAAKLLESIEKSDPEWIEPHVQLAALYYKLHRPEDGDRERAIVQRLQAQQQKQMNQTH